jgi:hypothetical protein
MTNKSERVTAQVLRNTSEHVTAQVFGLSLTAIFVGLLILNGISFWIEPGGNAPMPVLAFFAVVGSVLLALLFVADATLEQSGSPVIVTSQRTGLPAPRYDNAIKPLTTGSAPAPDMTSQAVLAAQPKSVSDALARIEPAAREARAEAPSKHVRIEASAKKARAEVLPQNQRVTQRTDYQQNQFDRFSIKGY